MRSLIALLVGGLALAGCEASPMTVECDAFRTRYALAVPRSPTLVEIQSDVPPPAAVLKQLASDRQAEPARAEAFAALVAQTLPDEPAGQNFVPTARPQVDAVLALSGGGQWGAFGAGFLDELNRKGRLPRFSMVTGVSTGALQALFVGAAQAPGADAAAVLGQLVSEYSIRDENEIVHRVGEVRGAIRGAMGELAPLRRKIENALCDGNPADPQEPGDCPLIEGLGAVGAPVVMLGFVEAGSGEMHAVNVSAIAQDALARKISMKTAQQCITAGALASVAMPFFYQQVQIDSAPPPAAIADRKRVLTYYDGGVRQSMFLMASQEALAKGLARAGRREADSRPLPIYLIRNGPTVAAVKQDADGRLAAIDTAMRGYSLIVNQSEVNAIELLRLRHPDAETRLATADGHDRFALDPGAKGGTVARSCLKGRDGKMFDPEFMECLIAFGREKARRGDRGHGWILLDPPGASRDRERPRD